MEPKASRSLFRNQFLRHLVSTICAIVLVPGDPTVLATPMAQTDTGQQTAATIPADQLDSLVAPIALYPDPLLTQTLVASTYPLEVIQLQQWLGQNKNLKDNALADAVKKQDWDPSIQALAAFPDVVKLLSENIKWTTDLGNAFLAQQNDVMDAVQRMRNKAKNAGNLKSTEQQKVETKVVENKQVIIVEQASPEVVYVPSYNPTVVYGAAPVYAYPPIAYPPVGYYAAGMAISFGIGVAMGAAWGGGGWGWNCGWGGHNNVYINNNNNFISNSNRNINNRNINYSNRTTSGSGNTWQHNPQHRGGAPYGDRATANRYGGTTRGESMASRRENAQRNQAQGGGLQRASERGSLGGQPGTRDRTAGGRGQPGASDRTAGARGQPGVSDRTAGGRDVGNRGAGVSAGDRGASRSGGGDRVGNRSVPSGGGGGAFGGGSGGFNGGNARASSSRGASSFGGGGRAGGGGGGRRR